jgi:hypothetical protein
MVISRTSFEIHLQFRLNPQENTVRDTFQTVHLASSSEYAVSFHTWFLTELQTLKDIVTCFSD